MFDPITLENDHLRVLISPARGMGILALYLKTGEKQLPIMPDATSEQCDLEWASFLMIPYSNRIENGCFTFQGREYRLQNSEEHAIHGDVRSRAWRVAGITNDKLICNFDSQDHGAINWPWPFTVEAGYELNDTTFSCSIRLTNSASEPAPAGFGWHPFFSRSLTHPGEEVRLRFAFSKTYPDANDNRIPSGPALPCSKELDFTSERALDPCFFIDACACDYDGKGCIAWPKSKVRAHFDCSRELGHLVLYNPVGSPYFAVEPVTNANNGVNLLANGDTTSGIRVLQPGQNLEACFRLRLEKQ